MSPSLTVVLVMLTSLTALTVSKPVKRDSQSLHIVEVPSFPHPESSSHSDQSSSHHLSQTSSTKDHVESSHSHVLIQAPHKDHLDSKSHHSGQVSQKQKLEPSQIHHLGQSHHHLGQPSETHKDHNTQIHPEGVHDHNEVHPQSKSEKKSRKGPKKGRKSNEDLLHHIGMTKLRSPAINHHRKRLASQSRKTHNQKTSSDSKMFVIKLPPNPYYYAHHNLNGYDVMEPQPNSVNKVPVNFKTNGKPSRVYHWNIPVLKKMVARKAGSAGKSAILADSDIFNIDKQATWNETDDEKSVYRKAVFYGPKKQSKHTFRKYYYGNGKPHSFYVMEKNKTPSSIYRLLP